MKAIFFLLSTILMLPLAANAQMPSGTFLFEEFTEGTILLTNKKTIETRFNYDCDNQVLYFLNGKEYMQMYNTTNVDTLRVGERLFIPAREGARFLECIPAGSDTLWVDWKIKSYYRGKAGAMGTVTQAGGQATFDMSLMQNKGASVPDNSVYKRKVQNVYKTNVGGTLMTFGNLKTFQKMFPEKLRKTVRDVAKEMATDFDNPWSVAQLLQKCREINRETK